MSYTPWMSGAVAAAKRVNAAVAARYRAEQHEIYSEYRAEQRACGYEVESFEQWMGETKGEAYDRYEGYASISDACYYGDTY